MTERTRAWERTVPERARRACPGCGAAVTAPDGERPDPRPLCRTCQVVGVVYLLHFSRRYAHAGHYSGWTTDLSARLAEHAGGRGARLLQVVRDAGITWTLARTWPGGRDRERALKRQGGAARRCPLCGVHPRTKFFPSPRRSLS